MKIVVDTNILVNVLLSPSKTNASFMVLEKCLSGQLKPQISCALFNEYEDVLSRPEIQAKAKYTTDEIKQILDGFLSVCTWVKINYLWRPNLRDEGDNHLIELAVASNTRWIVTQNIKDLKSGDLRFSLQSISPDQFIEVVYGNDHI